jgi:predicted transcriptional regulator
VLNQQGAIKREASMAEHTERTEQERPRPVTALTTEIVIAYVTRNNIAITDLGYLIGAVGRALDGLGREELEPAKPEPAVPVRRSIHAGYPMAAPGYSRQRSAMAKRVGLGQASRQSRRRKNQE